MGFESINLVACLFATIVGILTGIAGFFYAKRSEKREEDKELSSSIITTIKLAISENNQTNSEKLHVKVNEIVDMKIANVLTKSESLENDIENLSNSVQTQTKVYLDEVVKLKGMVEDIKKRNEELDSKINAILFKNLK